jgi:Bacterial SH3 domain
LITGTWVNSGQLGTQNFSQFHNQKTMMKRLSQLFTSLAMTTISLAVAFPVFAQPGVLEATDPRARINIRSQPTMEANAHHYGLSGDQVDVLEIEKGDDGYFWFYVQFKTSDAEGWVRGDLIHLLDYSPEDQKR